MRIMCVYIPRFRVQVERLRDPGLTGCPLVIGGLPEARATVLDCSDEAAEKGVAPFMPLREARHLCPEAVFVKPDEELMSEVWEEVLHALDAVTVRVEPRERGLVFLDITKALRLYASEEYIASVAVEGTLRSFGLMVKAGTGNSRFVAEQAALHAPHDVLVIPPGEEKEFVHALSADRLPVDEEIKERLRLLGLSRLDKVAVFSREALVSQFGSVGGRISDIVNVAEDKRQIPRRGWKVSVEKRVVGDAPFETMGQVTAALATATADISAELKNMGRLCRKMKLSLDLQNRKRIERTFVMKSPTAEGRDMRVRIVDWLRDTIMESPITGFTLATPELCADAGMQEPLFRKRPRLNERLGGVRGYLEALYGHTPLFMVREGEVNSLLPERRFRFVEV